MSILLPTPSWIGLSTILTVSGPSSFSEILVVVFIFPLEDEVCDGDAEASPPRTRTFVTLVRSRSDREWEGVALAGGACVRLMLRLVEERWRGLLSRVLVEDRLEILKVSFPSEFL